ncbi:MAG: hypothetical protein NXI27_24725 [Alphaproteobacteria bacterium]|nr:hypothetical protein [Alphaproteobacteria bacterium]
MTPWVRTIASAAIILSFAGASTGIAHADALGKIGGAVKGAGNAIKKGAQKTGEVIVKGAENTGEAIEKGIEKTGEALTGNPETDEELVQIPAPDTPRYVFVQQAQTAKTDGDVLILSGLTPSTYYFSDRPVRSAGHMRHTDFAALWDDQSEDGFRNDPPNAAVTTPDQIDDEPIVMELLTANYDGKEMSFRFKMISGNLPETSVNVAVFIDTNVWSDVNLAKSAEN